VTHVEHVWGTVVAFDVRLGTRDSEADAQRAIGHCVEWLHDVDRTFSTYREDSVVSGLRQGRVNEHEVSDAVATVLGRCRLARELTGGAFDPWAVSGGFDPSALVKGWAAAIAADILVRSGFAHVMVDAGGDVVVRSGADVADPWRIGIAHPDDPMAIIATALVTDGCVATSGTVYRGAHIVDPRQQAAASGARAATVVGPDAGLADALSTALMVEGVAGRRWFASLPGWSGGVVVGTEWLSWGPAWERSEE